MVHIVNISMFSAERVADPVGLADALRHLELLLAVPNADAAVAQIVRELLSVPSLFGFLMSVWPSSNKLVERIFSAFPNEPAFILESFVTDLLYKISHTLFSIPPDLLSADLSKNIGQFRQYVDNVLPVLAILCYTDFTSEASPPEEHSELVDGDIPFLKQKVKRQRRKVKQGTTIANSALFFKLEVPMPATNEEARKMANEITGKLRSVLQFYLDVLSNPELAALLKHAYITSPDHDTSEHPRIVVETSAPVVDTRPSAYPTVQPMKAALYFENADGFGEWRILIGTNATKKLREFRRNDAKKFKIVVKKIKELSNGQFSDDNQKRLDGARSGVPVFEAKMQRDLRLVYQIDCVPDHDGDIERQVIKIYEICTHTQLNRIWDAMNHHLSGKGKEYIQRCTFRNPPVHPGDKVYLPAVFPPEVHDAIAKPQPLVLGSQEMDQLHSLLVLDKYITFSQALINGLIAMKDVQHVFELTPQERQIVECTTSCYVLGRSGTGKTTTMLFKMLGIQRAWQLQSEGSGMPRPRQIFVTKSHVLATKVEEYFVKLLESLSLAGCTLEELARLKSRNVDRGLVDNDDFLDARSGIPPRYSELEDHHFPLFLTFDRLARMIAADILDSDRPETERATKLFVQSQDPEDLDSFVTYDVFLHRYWPRLAHLTKCLDPWPVFGEIMGIIKGSERSLEFDDGTLDQNTYCDLSSRTNPTFSDQRESVYALFEAYSKLKCQNQHHDIADRTHAVLKALLSGTPLKGPQVDFLYVDEAQDNLLIDALLLRLICNNPEGLFWAGDTAQTISAGSSFRFDDLKAFLYRIEVDQAAHLVRGRAVSPPASFQLAINYRSHGGIVNCAHSVIELISHFWPNSIDSLLPEHGVVDGLKPIFFTGWDKDTVRYEQFLFGTSGSHIEFGAQQCILVRDEKARERLQEQVGDIGLIMTLYESKGLEFNDVLLYNFFEDSTVDLSRWRLVLAAVDGAVEGYKPCQLHAPSFERDESRYVGLCRELKLLYVGITRARKNMWIVDKSDKGEPMKIFWTSRSQIQVCTPETDVPHLAVSSTSQEWAESGRSLFQHKRYTQAMHCFGRANMPHEVKIAEAYHLRELARAKIGIALLSEQYRAFAKAADAFVNCGNETPSEDRLQYYRTAADCYVRAADDRKAADTYLKAEEYELAAKRYRKAGMFKETLHVLESHSQKMSCDCVDELHTVCRLYYYCSKDDEKPPLPLFSSFEEELEFLETYGLDVALAALYESHGKYVEAAELHLNEDEPLDAIRVFLKDKTDRHAVGRAADILLECLWKHCSFGVPSKEFHTGIPKALISLSHQLPLDPLSPRARNEIMMFQAAAAEELDRATLEALAESFNERKEKAAALWCLYHVYSRLPRLLSATLDDLSRFLEKFYIYSQLLYIVASHCDPVGECGIRRLFGITLLSDDRYAVQPGSFILTTPSAESTSNDLRTNTSHTHARITNALKECVRSYLRYQVNTEIRLCYNPQHFSHCLSYVSSGFCNYAGCKQQHVSPSSLDTKQYNARIGIHLQQMRILQLVYSAFPDMRGWSTVKDEIADWIARLYETFFPPFRAQGSLADLNWSRVQGASDGIRVTRNWVRGAIYSLDPRKSTDFLTDILRLIKLSSAFGVSDALRNANCMRLYPPRILFRHPGRYIVADMIDSVESFTESSISAGILGLRHIIRSNLQVNLSVLCDCIEEVFSACVITLCLQNNPGADSLHDVVLPRSWLIGNNKLDARKDIRLILHLLDDIQYLLEKLKSDNAAGNFSLMYRVLTPVHRSIFIARICRMLCIASYNRGFHWAGLKARISNMINHLKSDDPNRLTPSIYRRYTTATSRDYLRVIVAYDEQHAIPNLVHLVCKGTRLWTSRFATEWHIEQLNYNRLDEIPALLASLGAAGRSSDRVEAVASVPRPVSLQAKPDQVDRSVGIEPAKAHELTGDMEDPLPEVDPTIANVAATEEAESAAHLVQRDQEGQVDPSLEDESAKAYEPVEDMEGPPLDDDQAVAAVVAADEEVSAARSIQRVYRQHHQKQKRQLKKTTLEKEISALFSACLKHAQAPDFAPGFYRLLYLGPLPHLLLALKKGIDKATSVRNVTKIPAMLLQEGHERLEEMGRKRNEISSTLKCGHELRKRLSPDSDFHKNRNINELRDAVLQVKEFLHRVPGGARGALEELNIAYKAIVAEKQAPQKKGKPPLNAEDVGPYEY